MEHENDNASKTPRNADARASLENSHNPAYQAYLERKHHERTPNPEKREGFWSEIIRFSVIALIIVIPIRIFIAQPFIVQGASMDPTFADGQYLIVDQLSYRFHEPERGDVIIFRYPDDPSKFFIKRVIALPGESINIDGAIVTIKNEEHSEGFTLDEFYVQHMRPDTYLDEELGEQEYFVMGDNRDFSSDSRKWGVLTRDHIVGRAYLRLLPTEDLGMFPGKVAPEEVEVITR